MENLKVEMNNNTKNITNSSDTAQEHLMNLLDAVVAGNEDLARNIITFDPELILDSSANAMYPLGKEVKCLTPLEAAICAYDLDMVRMIKEVLHDKLQSGVKLSFDPDLEIQRQFEKVFPYGIGYKEIAHKSEAQEFKTSTLNEIFSAINAATDEEVEFELKNPEKNISGSLLNTALNKFRAEFTATSNLDPVFNPFYLLMAFNFYNEKFNKYWSSRHRLFWSQVIGYIQRQLPACFSQAISEHMESTYDADDLTHSERKCAAMFQKLLRTKKLGLEMLCAENDSATPIVKNVTESLLTAVAYGNEDLVRSIVTSNPELILDSSAIVIDISGKEIKELTPLQAAICAGDVGMVQMIKEVLHDKLQNGVKLSFDPDLEIQRQFEKVFPNGIIAVEMTQKFQAEKFKTSALNEIFSAINAATDEQIEFELDNPARKIPNSLLNTALNKFRAEFMARSIRDQIFNPFYLLAAFEFYGEQFDKFKCSNLRDCNRRDLFWRQVIGYIQRHLSACYLQAFAQGIYPIVEKGEKLNRDFEYAHYKGSYMRADIRSLDRLGFEYAVLSGVGRCGGPYYTGERAKSDCGGVASFKNYCEQKNQVWRSYIHAEPNSIIFRTIANTPLLDTVLVLVEGQVLKCKHE
jgi:hypothetical protein